jgi:hypothetical protein
MRMGSKKSSKKRKHNESKMFKLPPCILEKYIKPEKNYTSDELSAIAKKLVMDSEEPSHDKKLVEEYAMTAITLYHMLASNNHQFTPCDLIYMEKAMGKIDSKKLKQMLDQSILPLQLFVI